MKRSDFFYHLPEERIAQYPTAERSQSRLLHLQAKTGRLFDHLFPDVLGLINEGDLLVFNNTRVIPARLFGKKQSGGRVEIMLERLLGRDRFMAQIRASKSPKPNSTIMIDELAELIVRGKENDMYLLQLSGGEDAMTLLQRHGHMPLPPYIQRDDESLDQERYQTVYASSPGAVAAPTAGLHFDEKLLDKIKDKGIEQAFVTLHVGAGTFQPVRAEVIEDHHMHSEYIEVDALLCEKVKTCREKGGRVIAVGTTSLRCLESASLKGSIEPYKGDTDIFIYPGFDFKTVDALISNFHLPESTLLMLVSAFAGKENIFRAYEHAINNEYRFFSYGDAMFIEKGEV